MKKKKEAPFHRICVKLWTSKRFLGLSEGAKLLWFYLATSPHHGGAACYRLNLNYAAADIGTDLAAINVSLEELVKADAIVWDGQTDELLIRRWFQHASPTNPKHAAGFHDYIMKVESGIVGDLALQELENTEHGGEFIRNPSSAGR